MEDIEAALGDGKTSQKNGNSSAHKLFNHCLHQNLAMIYAREHQMIRNVDPDLFNRLSRLLFQRKHGSLEYASPHILESLLNSTKHLIEEHGELSCVSESKQMQHIQRKVQHVVEQQQQAVKSSKMAVYKMIPRWMPFSIPLYIEPLKKIFKRLSCDD